MQLPRSVIGMLMTEHRLIDRVIDDINRTLGGFEQERSVDPAYVETLVDFIRWYALECHHGKEERILFRALESKPLTPEQAEVMARLIREHRQAADLTTRMHEANGRYVHGDDAAFDAIEASLREIAELYPEHVRIEEREFFKPAISYFTKEERDAMAEEFVSFDRMLIHERYERVVEQLEAAHGVVVS